MVDKLCSSLVAYQARATGREEIRGGSELAREGMVGEDYRQGHEHEQGPSAQEGIILLANERPLDGEVV